MKVKVVLRGRPISSGEATGRALVSRMRISFFGDVDRTTGRVINRDLDIYGRSLKDVVFVAPGGRGSTVGAWILYALKRRGVAPAAIILEKADTVVTSGCIIAGIPLVDSIPRAHEIIREGDLVKVFEDGRVVVRREVGILG